MSRIVKLGKEYRQRGGLEARVFMVLPVSTNFAVLGAYRGNDGEWYPGNWMSDGRLTRSGPTPLDLIEGQTEVTMTTTPEQIEAVVQAMRKAWDGASDDTPVTTLLAESAINAMRPFIRAEALKEAARVAGCAPYNKGGIVCGCSEGLANWIEAEILALKEKP